MKRVEINRADDRSKILGFAKARRTDSPMLLSDEQFDKNLLNADLVLEAHHKEETVGVFSFCVILQARYIECLAALTNSSEAVCEAVGYLREHFGGYDSDWVLRPYAEIADDIISLGGTAHPALLGYETEANECELSPSLRIKPLSPEDFDAYAKIHDKDCYWAAERVVSSGRFTVLLADNEDGYIDIFTDSDIAEVYSWRAAEADLKKELLKEALRVVEKSIFIMLEEGERQEMQAVEALGFKRKPETDNLTIGLKL